MDLDTLQRRYIETAAAPALSYATVRDYCDSADHFGELATRNQDLKDAQRPWAVKAILNRVKRGGRLLEIGGGEPLAASLLTALGYHVAICDPFDGSGHGPTEFRQFRKEFPQIEFIRSNYIPNVANRYQGQFDCVFSISVLEHVLPSDLGPLFQAIAIGLKPGGWSIHAVDHVLEGHGDLYHVHQVAHVVKLQATLAGLKKTDEMAILQVQQLCTMARADLETLYLSPQGHNLWRGATPYDQFPFRKCISVQTLEQLMIFTESADA
jgi:SAM-dependent methyltransferase